MALDCLQPQPSVDDSCSASHLPLCCAMLLLTAHSSSGIPVMSPPAANRGPFFLLLCELRAACCVLRDASFGRNTQLTQSRALLGQYLQFQGSVHRKQVCVVGCGAYSGFSKSR